MPDSNVIVDLKISELEPAAQANADDQLEANQAGTTRRITVDQVSAAVAASDWVQDQIDLVVSGDSGVWHLKAHGAIGDGITDDSAAVQAAITAAAGKIIDGGGLIYKIMLPLTGVASNTTIRNATFDFSAMPAQPGNDDCLSVIGTVGSTMALTSDAPAGTNAITIASTASLAVDDLVFFTSTALIGTTAEIYGQYERVKLINSATQFTVTTPLAVSYTTAATAVVKKVSPVTSVVVRDCKFIGAGANLQCAVNVDWCDKAKVLHNEFRNFDRAAVQFTHCHRPLADGNSMYKGVGDGFSYGVILSSGCYHAKIVNNFGEDLRHTVTIGGSGGINLYTLVANNHALNAKDAGFDSHTSAMYTTFANNIVESAAEQFLASANSGIISESGPTTIIGNIVKGPLTACIVYQPSVTAQGKASLICTNNKVVLADVGLGSTSGVGVNLDIRDLVGSDVESAIIADNQISGGASNPSCYGILVHPKRSGSRIKTLTIARNQISDMTDNGIYVRASTGAIYDQVNISDNNVETLGSARAIYLLISGTLANLTGGGNIVKSGLIGIELSATAPAMIGPGNLGSNIYRSGTGNTTLRTTGTGVTNVILQDAVYGDIVNFPNPTATVASYTNHWTFNRATAQVVTLLDPTLWKNTEIDFRTIAAGSVDSATANITPLAGGAATTVIFPAASPGKWAVLRSDGTTWRIVKAN